MAEGFVGHHDDRIAGVLSCYDRIIIVGTLPCICYAKGMTALLRALQNPSFNIAGIRRFRHLGLIKRSARTYPLTALTNFRTMPASTEKLTERSATGKGHCGVSHCCRYKASFLR